MSPGFRRVCPWDKVGLSPGTNPGFLLILHSGSPVRPWDKPSLSQGHSGDKGAAERVYVQGRANHEVQTVLIHGLHFTV